MASASSSAARVLIRDGKTAARLLLRSRTANLTETMQNTGPAIQSLLWFNQTPARQYPVIYETFPVMHSSFRVGFVQQETVSKRSEKMEVGHEKRVVDDKAGSDSEEEETDFDEEEFDDIDDDEEFDDIDEDDGDDDEEEEEDDKYTRKKK